MSVDPGAAPTSKGHLNPGSPSVRFDRFSLGRAFDPVVRHVWAVRWVVPEGVVLPQRVLGYPAYNVVVDASGAALHGPTARVQVRELRGRAWAVGILLRPAAGHLLAPGEPPAAPPEGLPLADAPVAAIASCVDEDSFRHPELDDVLRCWLRPALARVDDTDALVNEACRLAEEDHALVRASDLAARAGVTPRTLERATRSRLGLSPKWLLECRRLQEAATRVRADPSTDVSALAAALGYVDYAHLSRRYKAVLGETPDQTRRSAGRDRERASPDAAPERVPHDAATSRPRG